MASQRGFLVWFLLLGAGGLAGVIHLASNGPAMASIAWGIALIVSGVSIAFYGSRQFDMFSPIFFIGISFAIFYGLSAIVPFLAEGSEVYNRMILPVLPYYPLAGMTSFLCLSGLYFGYTRPLMTRVASRSSLLRWRASALGLKILWAVLLGLGTTAFVILLASNVFLQTTTQLQSPLFYSAVGFIQSGLTVAIGIAVAFLFIKKNAFWTSAAIVSVFILLVFGIPTGSKTLALLTFALTALAINYSKRRFARKEAGMAILGVMVVLLILMPFNAVYRTILLDSASSKQSFAESVNGLYKAGVVLLDNEFKETINLSIDYASARLSNLSVVANIIGYQDEGGKLHYGESYARAFYGLIPRFVWPEKPGLTIGQEFAVELGYKDPETTRLGKAVSNTSVGVTLVGEQVYNFTLVLAPIGMIFLGMFYRLLYEVFLRAQSAEFGLAIGVYSLWWYTLVFSAHETNFAAVLMGAIKFTIFLLLLFYFLKFKKLSSIKQGRA